MSSQGARVGRLLVRLSNQCTNIAQQEEIPQDLMQKTIMYTVNASTSNHDSSNTTEEDEKTSISMANINYCQLVTEGGSGKTRREMESFGCAGQEKEAKQVNSRRGGGENTVECIGKRSICI
jgi:hypothetical protein